MRPKRVEGVNAVVLFSHIVGLFKVMAGVRGVEQETPTEQQEELPFKSSEEETSSSGRSKRRSKIYVFKVARKQSEFKFSKAS